MKRKGKRRKKEKWPGRRSRKPFSIGPIHLDAPLEWSLCIAVAVIAASLFMGTLQHHIAPPLMAEGEKQARAYLSAAVEDCVEQQLAVTFDDLIRREEDAEGKLLTLTTDTEAANNLKHQAAKAVTALVEELEAGTIAVPLGLSTQLPFLEGQGPRIPVKVTLSGRVETALLQDYTELGGGKLRQSLALQITLPLRLTVLKESWETQLETAVFLGEALYTGTNQGGFLSSLFS